MVSYLTGEYAESMRTRDKKAVVSVFSSFAVAWFSYGISSPFFREQMGGLMGIRFSDMIGLFYAATVGGIVFVLLMFLWKDNDEHKKKGRAVQVKRFKL